MPNNCQIAQFLLGIIQIDLLVIFPPPSCICLRKPNKVHNNGYLREVYKGLDAKNCTDSAYLGAFLRVNVVANSEILAGFERSEGLQI